jgi:Domain of unknown function (DUF4189)
MCMRRFFLLLSLSLLVPTISTGGASGQAQSPAAVQCDTARDRRIREVVAAEIRTALQGQRDSVINARVAGALRRIRALPCSGPAVVRKFGAIVIGGPRAGSTSPVFSWSRNLPTQDDADERALRDCDRRRGVRCRIVQRIAGVACGAYAVGRSTGEGSASGSTPQGAERLAVLQCSTNGGQYCRVVRQLTTCNSE